MGGTFLSKANWAKTIHLKDSVAATQPKAGEIYLIRPLGSAILRIAPLEVTVGDRAT